jgi:long-chain acyl-CoA synthetase
MLSNRNFNALGLQIACQGPIIPGDTILSILPMFHGFGLGICIHTFLIKGGRCILMPNFTPESVAVLIRKKKPQYIAGVPTLFEALLRNKLINRESLKCLKTAYVGGDKLPQNIKERFDKLIKKQGGKAELLEGYGLTESVTACIVTPGKRYRAGSMGIPLPDILAKVVIPGTCDEARAGSDGELCISGPTVMLGYLNSPEDTDRVLKKHDDGRIWLHTGDICSMDSDGYFYFKLRMKRIVKVSGISVSPVQVEEVLAGHPDIALSCVIGIPDEYKMQVLKAYVVLRDPSEASGKKGEEIIGFCRKSLNKWSVPAEVEFRKFLPLTKIGKVSYRDLEKENGAGNARF